MKISDVVTAIVGANNADSPIFLWGAPGIGKTSLMDAVRDVLGVELLTLRTNLYEPVDFTGYPFPSGDVMKFLPPSFIPKEGTRGILFLDELAQAPMATQCAAMRLVDHLPKGWQVVAASNRATDRAGAGQVATHVLSRFTHLDVDVSREDWQSWASKSGIAPEVRAFIDFRPGLLFNFDAAVVQKERANCSPRAWHRVSRILQTCDKSVLLAMLTGTVGQGAAAEFYGFLRIFAECPNPDVILADPKGTMVPREPSALFAVCAALADRAKTLDTTGLGKLADYFVRLPVEFGALLITDVLSTVPVMLTIPAIGKWITEHRDVFASPRS